jgi:hypothetical protein
LEALVQLGIVFSAPKMVGNERRKNSIAVLWKFQGFLREAIEIVEMAEGCEWKSGNYGVFSGFLPRKTPHNPNRRNGDGRASPRMARIPRMGWGVV